jgi:branched-chain amino acid transport system ATP-binding protein
LCRICPKSFEDIQVEQNANISLQVSARAYVIEKGEVTLNDSGQALLNNEFVKKAFLGM